MSKRINIAREKTVKAGCLVCHGIKPAWHGEGAEDIASHHTHITGHETWADITTAVSYKKAE